MESNERYEGPIGYVFAVSENPYCCWDFDHEARSLAFLDGLDPDYFGTVASLCMSRLDTEDAVAVSVMLRVSYHQGLETLMSLLGAAVQAPSAIPAWIAQCSTGDLEDLVGTLRDGRPVLTQNGRHRWTFVELSEYVHRFAWADEIGEDSTAALFGRFWRRLASEVIDETARAEYNALKHGNRVRAGGFTLAIGVEKKPGVPAAPEAMHSLGGSPFGTTFFASERVSTAKHHIRTCRTSVNWSPEALAQRLFLISMSITNIVGALRCNFGIDPATVTFVRPDPWSAFDDVWAREPRIRTSAMDSIIRIDPRDERSRHELLAMIEGRDQPDNGFRPTAP